MARVYANVGDLVAYTAGSSFSVPAEPEATRRLTRASELVDEALITAVYDTDASGYATDATIRQAFRDATCAQVVWWAETGDELGTSGQFDSVSIGSVSLSRGSRTGAQPGTGGRILAPQARTHLQLAGLLPGVVIHGW